MTQTIIALSGGVDSAVAALLLLEAKHTVTAVFMQNWHFDQKDLYCTYEQDLSDAQAVANYLNIPLTVIDFSKAYWHSVFERCLDEFVAGRTPNPDVLCNQEIKFNVFLDYVLAQKVDFLATGHYAKKQLHSSHYQLHKGVDTKKDQSYFLHRISQHALKHSIFPLANYSKIQVRSLAQKKGLPNYNKKDSTGLCFIGKRKFKPFLQEFLCNQPGPIQTVSGRQLGKHDGLMFYTIGQRKGLHIGGQKNAQEQPWYVLKKQSASNTLIVGQGHDHPLLFSRNLTGTSLHWHQTITPHKRSFRCTAKIRYQQTDQPCYMNVMDDGFFNVQFDCPQWAITPGQSVVFYHHTHCLGGGIICETS